MKSKTKKLVTLLVIGLFFPLLVNKTLDFDVEQMTFNNLKNSSVYNGGIEINALATTNTTYSGNWTWAVSQPWCYEENGVYIIENMTIDASSSPTGNAIYIKNSKNDYFIIKNCTVYNAGGGTYDAGIKLENTNNGTLTNNNCSDNQRFGIILHNNCNNNTISGNSANGNLIFGIFLATNCDDNIISGNTIYNNSRHGVYLYAGSTNNIISGNTIHNNGENGIHFNNNCDNNNITANDVNNNGDNGIYLYDGCNNNNISGNTANDNILIGLCLGYNSGDNNIKNNTIHRNDLGIMLHRNDYNNVSDNILKDNGYCIYEFESTGNLIENNDCSVSTLELPIFIDGTATGVGAHNWTWAENQPWCSGSGTWTDPYIIESLKISGFGLFNGIYIRNSNAFFIIQDCKVYNSEYWGIRLRNVNNSSLIDNNCFNNEYSGIYLQDCDNNTISGNTANNNGYEGIYFEGSDNVDNTISGNTANNNELGICIEANCNNTISGNTANGNSYCGIYLGNCDNNNVTGNIANNNDYEGISLDWDCYNNTISGNTVNDNKQFGIHLYDNCDSNDITNNILYNNTLGIWIESRYNSIYKNFFLANGIHAMDNGTDNKWNSTTIGNYWDNHTGPDVFPNDGIVDTQYNISGSAGSIDHLPIAEDGAPSITINSPSEGDGFSSVAPNFSVTITEDYLDTMWYTLDGGLHNYTFTENGIINQSAWDGMDDGAITLTFYARDIPGNIGSAGVDTIKDTVAPILVINSPAEGDRFGKNAPLFNITVTEDNLDILWYSFDGGVSTYAITNNTVFNQTAWIELSQGDVTITFYARDIAGNEATEEVSVIKSVPSGLDPGVIITIVIVSIVGGVAVIAGVYIFMKKRAVPT